MDGHFDSSGRVQVVTFQLEQKVLVHEGQGQRILTQRLFVLALQAVVVVLYLVPIRV
jgi:hypothetical protein